MKKLAVLLFCIFFMLKHTHAQESKLGNWLAYVGTYDVAKKWNVQLVTQTRFHNLMGDWDQYLLRAGANYKLDKNGDYSFGAGVDYFFNSKYIGTSDVKNEFNEFRLYEQFVSNQNYKRFYLQHRYRLENRFIESQDVKFRFRYMLQVKMALTKKRIEDHTFYLALLNETFINLNALNHFDRHWLHYTLGYKLNNHWTFEVGNQTQFTGASNYNSRLQFWAFHTMDWRKLPTRQKATGRF